MATDPIIGIDLGTTNSLVGVSAWPGPADLPRILPAADGGHLVPSVVRIDDAGVVVGALAKAQAAEHPRGTIASVKRLMGRGLEDAQGDLPYLSYKVVQGPGQTARVQLSDGRLVSPQEVSAHILRALRAQASAALGVQVGRAVITVPAYFDDAQRQATRDAARLAGLEAVRLIAEPTAAALAYGLGLRAGAPAQTIVVYDLGGGTFDVSVLRLTPGVGATEASPGADAFEVLATAGDTHLGGDDIDFAIVGWLAGQLQALRPGLPVPSDGQRRALLALAEGAKIELSKDDEVEIDLARALPECLGAPLRVTLTRAVLEALAGPLIERTIAACGRAVRDARVRMEGDGIDAVILVGGSTRMPVVRRRVREHFKIEPYTAIDPDEAVALGAAVQASILSGATTGAMLLDVIPLSLGLETAGGGVAKIIMRNAPVPAEAHEMFSTQVDNQGSIRLNIVQGEREMAGDCRSLGVYHLGGIPAMPAGLPQLRVEFRVDINGILGVSALEQRSGRRLDVQIVPNHGLTRQEVERIERESFAMARQDMARHRIADLIATGALDLGWVRTQLGRYGAGLASEPRGRIEGAIATLSALLERARGNWEAVAADELMRAKEALDHASVPLHELAMTRALQQGEANQQQPGGSVHPHDRLGKGM